MGLTTTGSLRCTLVTLTRSASSLLWSRLLARTGHITASLDPFPNRLSLVLEVFECLVNEISPQRLIEIFLVKCNDLISEPTGDEAVDRHIHVLARVKGPLSPWLTDEQGLISLGEAELGRVKLIQRAL